ncbi:MAG: 5-amino-6-(D-ribitylamino)uracil--L-tyrosine 4-hydroxyphenyl transferase CofH, partial [Gammaproteobacteria bacterium]
ELIQLEEQTAQADKILCERLTLYPQYIAERDAWLDNKLRAPVLHHADASGLARTDCWSAGEAAAENIPAATPTRSNINPQLQSIIDRAMDTETLQLDEIVALFAARGNELEQICAAADQLRRDVSGDTIRYVVNRNINYTNVCTYKCKFCAFSKGKTSESLRGTPYLVDLDEIARRTQEAWQRGATEICLQGGIHPAFTGQTYLDICATVKAAAPDIHVHAFSPLEVTHGAHTLGTSIEKFLQQLRDAGLGTLPGTAAEILDDDVRKIICPDKITTAEWLNVIRTAHEQDLRTTSTIMFGHLETSTSWATHLLELRELQADTGGITEFVPLPFVHMEAPMYRRGMARPGPTWREVLLMHAVARLALHPHIPNIQVSWVKLGAEGAGACLNAGANDLGGTLMNESISRAAGADHGQEFCPEQMDALIQGIGRQAAHRDTLYRPVSAEQAKRSYNSAPLAEVVNRHAREYQIAS